MCSQPIVDVVVRVEVVERLRSDTVVWGPVPVHRACEPSVVTPFDPYLGPRYIRLWRSLDAVPQPAPLGLHLLDR